MYCLITKGLSILVLGKKKLKTFDLMYLFLSYDCSFMSNVFWLLYLCIIIVEYARNGP